MLFSTDVSYLPRLDARGNGGPGVLTCYFAMAFHIYLDVDDRGDEGPGVLCYFGLSFYMYLDMDAHGNGGPREATTI